MLERPYKMLKACMASGLDNECWGGKEEEKRKKRGKKEEKKRKKRGKKEEKRKSVLVLQWHCRVASTVE